MPSNFQRSADSRSLQSNDEWKFSPLKRKGVYSSGEQSLSLRNVNEIASSLPNRYFSDAGISSPSTPERLTANDSNSYSSKSGLNRDENRYETLMRIHFHSYSSHLALYRFEVKDWSIKKATDNIWVNYLAFALLSPRIQ